MQEGDLTDEQVEQMLARATQRLKDKSQSTELAKRDQAQRYNFPKLQTGTLEQPYVYSNGDVATLDSKRLLEQKQRKGANGIRKVEDPVAAKETAQEVRSPRSFLFIAMAMRKSFRIHSLSGARAPSWFAFLPNERFIIKS